MGEQIYGRPELTKDMGSKRFREFYYLETELIDFCKKNALDFSGDRNDLTERIANFMAGKKADESGFILKNQTAEGEIADDTLIEPNFEYEEKHKKYFTEVIGPEYLMFDDFLAWLESNAGKTFGEAVNIWFLIRDDLGIY